MGHIIPQSEKSENVIFSETIRWSVMKKLIESDLERILPVLILKQLKGCFNQWGDMFASIWKD